MQQANVHRYIYSIYTYICSFLFLFFSVCLHANEASQHVKKNDTPSGTCKGKKKHGWIQILIFNDLISFGHLKSVVVVVVVKSVVVVVPFNVLNVVTRDFENKLL